MFAGVLLRPAAGMLLDPVTELVVDMLYLYFIWLDVS
jgi:hypothetical protein